MPLERLRDKTTKEVLWIYILRLLHEEDMYAYEIKKEIKERFKFEPATVTGYVVLYRLKSNGYVKKSREEQGEGGSSRKYYSITPKGRKLLAEGLEYLNELTSKLSLDNKHEKSESKEIKESLNE